MTGLPVKFPWVALVGPTAVGKTALSLRLATEIRAEIVNFDSVQVYRGLDIGSAKPTPEERAVVPHHLIDILDPDEPFDAAGFARKARGAVRSITGRGRTVLLVGGTGLYLKALLQGLVPSPGGDPLIRSVLRGIAESKGPEALHELLKERDLESALRIHPNDIFRVIRALEVYELTGKTMSEWRRLQKQMKTAPPCCIKVGLIRPREELYRRINARVDEMLEHGLIEEVKALLEQGYSTQLKPLQTLGYRHVAAYLEGRYTLSEAVRLLKRDTRRYAKRQLTWFRADPEVRWFHPDELLAAESVWHRILSGGPDS